MFLKNEKIQAEETTYSNNCYISPYKSYYVNQESTSNCKRFMLYQPKYYKSNSDNKINLMIKNDNYNSKKNKEIYQLKYYENIRKEIVNDEKHILNNNSNKIISDENFKKYLKIAKFSEYSILPNHNKKMLNIIDYLVITYNIIFGIYFVNKMPKILYGNSICIIRKMIVLGINFGITNSMLSLYRYYNLKRSFEILFGSFTEYEIFRILEELEIDIIL